jgi:hypothetical protein
MAPAKKVKRQRKVTRDAVDDVPHILTPALAVAELEPTERRARTKSRVASADTASPAIGSPIADAINGNHAALPSSSPPWPLWDKAAAAKPSKLAWLPRLRVRQLSPMATTIAIAAFCGAITGSLATVGVAKFMPLDVSTSAEADLAQQIVRVDAELATLKASFSAFAKADTPRLTDTAERQDPKTSAASDTTGSLPEVASTAPASASAVAVTQPSIPIVEGWVLRNVYGGSALVEGRSGLIQVMPGDSLPGVGRVETIKREDGRWVVVTTRGLIVAR